LRRNVEKPEAPLSAANPRHASAEKPRHASAEKPRHGGGSTSIDFASGKMLK
jgi:hypothetical protein